MKSIYPIKCTRSKKIVDNDHSLVACLINSETEVTEIFLYVRCSPLFNALYQYWYTTHTNKNEIADDVYLHVMTPKPPDNTTKLQKFAFQCIFIGWFYKVAKHFCITKWRKHRRLVFCSKEDMELYQHDKAVLPIEIDPNVVSHVIEHLPQKRYREVLRLRYIEDLNNEETADFLGETPANCSRLVYKAKKQFEEKLKEMYPILYNDRKKITSVGDSDK